MGCAAPKHWAKYTTLKEQVIVIKPCDKGGGVIISDFEKYRESCLTHLKSKTATSLPYYKQIPETAIKPMIKNIDKNLNAAFKAGFITEDERKSMSAKEKGPGCFCNLFPFINDSAYIFVDNIPIYVHL